MVQFVPRRPDLDAPANATEHKAIRDKPWVSFPHAFPMSRTLWKIDSAGIANSVGDARPISKVA
jgi:hypothetical protein